MFDQKIAFSIINLFLKLFDIFPQTCQTIQNIDALFHPITNYMEKCFEQNFENYSVFPIPISQKVCGTDFEIMEKFSWCWEWHYQSKVGNLNVYVLLILCLLLNQLKKIPPPCILSFSASAETFQNFKTSPSHVEIQEK